MLSLDLPHDTGVPLKNPQNYGLTILGCEEMLTLKNLMILNISRRVCLFFVCALWNYTTRSPELGSFLRQLLNRILTNFSFCFFASFLCELPPAPLTKLNVPFLSNILSQVKSVGLLPTPPPPPLSYSFLPIHPPPHSPFLPLSSSKLHPIVLFGCHP